jgi:alpha-D-ribose 1-methylphosphonate 5-phosphate C-P lyase
MADALYLFGAGREKRIYAIPPYTRVQPLEFEDFRFRRESFKGYKCVHCGSDHTYMDEYIDEVSGRRTYRCSDTSYCDNRRQKSGQQREQQG